ncbi:hypothetical protein [Paenibacillus alkalitolerans]|uniref:hypothetical protein n=1 Tax=Paenibacillus alkalitolerans TaxID=2799335 RepID=UPI0018F589FC|nr:hypothetical protein [Paenibacillus alkalitolerans]
MNINLQAKTITLPQIPKKIKKITGTRLAPILGLSPWTTDFEVWCDMTGTYKIPFEDTIYTIAGKVIEPKVIAYLDKKYYFGKGLLKGAEDWYGKTTKELRFDHFPDESIFGGMWDARTKTALYELKTTKRVEDWYKGGKFSPPEYYKVQGALYAYLLGLDEFRMVLTILEEKDYANPENFEPSPTNTIVKKYSVAAEYPNFSDKLDAALAWYEKHIDGCVSPMWDDKKDKEIVKALTTAHVSLPAEGEEQDIVAALIQQIEPLQAKLDALSETVAEDEKTLDQLKKQLKAELESRMKESDKKIEVAGQAYRFEVTKAAAGGIDTDRLKKDGLYEQYKKTGFTTKITIGRNAV